MLAAQGIATGDIDIAVAGGMESMSNAPYLLPRVREGLRMGNGELVDSMINDGLWCAFENCHMGNVRRGRRRDATTSAAAEQDAYAADSHRKAARGDARGLVQGRDPADHDSAERRATRSSSTRDEPIRADTTSKRSAR